MPYQVDLQSYGLASDILLAGWFAAVPFSFSPAADGNEGGEIMAQWDKLVLICHLATEREEEATFRSVSSEKLAGQGAVTVKKQEGESRLATSNVRLSQVCAQQSTGSSETLWVYRGVGANTGAQWTPPGQEFADWGREDANRNGWKGEAQDKGRLSFARVDWTGSRYFQAIHLAGPSGGKGAGALVNTVLSCMKPFAGNPPAPAIGSACTTITLHDGSRTNRDLEFLGSTPQGRAQVQGASGSVWFSQGTLAALTPEALIRLGMRSHQRNLDVSELLGDVPLAKTMTLGVGGEEDAHHGPDLVFEGLSLWNLQRRGGGVNDPPVLL